MTAKPHSNPTAKRRHAPDPATKSPIAARALEVEADAMELRKAGLTYSQIGARLGLTKAGAYDAVHRAIEKHRAAVKEDVGEVVTIELERLDALYAVVYQQATDGDHGALDRCLSIAARRAKLLGLDAPNRQELSGTLDLVDTRPALAALAAALPEPGAARSSD